MAALIPLLPEAAAGLAEVITDAEIETAASTALLDGVGGEVIAGAGDLLTGTAEGGEVVLEPIFEGDAAALNPDNPAILSDVTQVTNSQLRVLWQSARAFARWTGQEILKGALFQVALEAIISLIKQTPPSDFAASGLLQVLTALTDSLKILHDVEADWLRWTVKHFGNKENYGVIITEGTSMMRFEIFRNHLANLTLYLQKDLAPLLATLKGDASKANIGGLKAATKTWTNMFLTLAQEVQQKETLMTHAGLQNHIDDIEKCLGLLT